MDSAMTERQEPRLLLSVAEVVELTGIGRDYIRDELRRGHLKSMRIGRVYKIPRRALEEWIATQAGLWVALGDAENRRDT
jgi:excisionase family DNA binding protein